MYTVGLVAAEANAESALRVRLVEALAAEGSVATVKKATAEPPDTGDMEVHVTEDGAWTARGAKTDLTAVLDRIAPNYDYAVVTGFPRARIPHVVVGATEFEGETLLSVDSPEAVTAEAVLKALEDIEPHVTLESLVAEVKRSPDADRAGAIATFTGRVRKRDAPDDRPTTRLEFEKYEGVAEDRLADLEAQLGAREGVQDVRLHHRTGVIPSGRDIVFVVVLAGHREEAFRTVEDGINRLKAEVPIFKKEVTVEEEFWVHDRS